MSTQTPETEHAGAPADDWVEAMAPAAFHGVAGEFVRLVEPQTESDPAALLVNFLVQSAALFGREAFCVADGATHYPVEFVATVGRSGQGRKGTATRQTRNVMDSVEDDFSGKHIIAGLSSGEGLVKILQDQKAGNGVLCLSPEFGSVLTMMRREGNVLSAIIRQAFDSDRLQIPTKQNPLSVNGYFFSILAHITPEELLAGLSALDRCNGFGNRFLYFLVRRSKYLPEGGQPVDLTPVVRSLRKAVEASKCRGQVERDFAAKVCWAQTYPRLVRERTGLKGALCSRAEAHVLRLSLLYALLDGAKQIRLEHLQAALAVWDYSERSVGYVFATATGDPDEDKIMRYLSSGPKTRTELIGLFGNNRPAEWIMAKMRELERCKLVRPTLVDRERKTGLEAWELVQATNKRS